MDKPVSLNSYKNALITPELYNKKYQDSVDNPDKFWATEADKFLTFEKKWDKVSDWSFKKEDLHIKWFEGAKLNVCYNCIDRHLPERANQTAIIWEGDNPDESKKITYSELHKEVCKFANILKNIGVKKGDVVTIYLPMILEAAYAMLACARIGAIHSVVFGGFSSESLKGRIEDGKSNFVITTESGNRGGKKTPLLENVNEAVKDLEGISILLIDNSLLPPLSLPPHAGGAGGGQPEFNRPIGLKKFTSRKSLSLAKAKALRQNQTDVEKKLWNKLKTKQLENYKFRRQHPVGTYITDFTCVEKKLIIELDGGQHSENIDHDNKRTEFLNEAGFEVLRFWNFEVNENLEGVLQVILGHLENNTPHLTSPRKQGEEHREKNIFLHSTLYKTVSDNCNYEIMDAEDPLFILYTSGSTGKPKGLMHTSAGYLLQSAATHKYTFDYQEGDIYWCTADVGWITGHSYILYGPLANGATTLMFEGVPTYPDASRFWQVIDKHKVNQFYTAPTAIRMLMGAGDDFVKKTSRKSLRILGSVGEPINPEAWRWYHKVVGNENCPVVDTWWQTETGAFMITPLPYAIQQKPGSATKPFFGIKPAIVNDKNEILSAPSEGNLCILNSWPSQARTIWGDHNRFFETYFSQFLGKYFTGDGAKQDQDGYFWITGRVDDVLNVAGHRLGTAEIESALVLHHSVAEAAVVGYPHDIKGQGIYAYVTLKKNISPTEELKKELFEIVRKTISPIAKPDLIQFAPALPKTRSGKIMRRILRKIAENSFENLGDTKTLLNPEAVDELINNRLNK